MSRWQRIMDTSKASEYLGIPGGTLARWRVEGTGPAYFKLGLRVRYERSALDQWMQAQIRSCTSDSNLTAVAV